MIKNSNPESAPKISFPCDYPVIVITLALSTEQESNLKNIFTEVDKNFTLEIKPSKKNNYLSHRFHIKAKSETQIKKTVYNIKTIVFYKKWFFNLRVT